MSAKPPYYAQETDYSCGAACLRMVLEYLGVVKTEEELRELTDTVFDGARAYHIVLAARGLNFPNSAKHNLNLQELIEALVQGIFPIVYIRTRLHPQSPLQEHAIVVVEFKGDGILILDPARGELTLNIEEFKQMWQLTRGLTILIE